MPESDKVDILVVDDLPDKLLVLESVLAELDENVVIAHSGPEALRRVLERDFAVILLDVNMPGMDGFETAAMIRSRKRSAHVPIIFLTAFADEMHTARGYSLGAVDYILSPVVPVVLRTKVKVFVELFRMTRQVKQQAEERVALEREQSARAAAEEATRRSAFLAEASKALAGSLDFTATLRCLARLPVPFLADLAAVTFAGETGQSWTTELAWRNPPNETMQTCTLCETEAPHDELRLAVERVLDSGQRESVVGLTLPIPGTAGMEANQRLGSALILPLVARGRIQGALTLAWYVGKDRLPSLAIALAEEFAGRAAIALDNARLYREIQEADRRKNEFLAMLAHELRNPLAPIRNAVQIMEVVGVTDPAMQEARGMIERQVQHLVRLVDDLLDISRITRGKIQLRTEPVEAAAVVARAVEVSRPLLEARGHAFTVSLPPEPLWVHADIVRLAQVLANLLNNAAKYTEVGGQVSLSVEKAKSSRGLVAQVVFRVRDSGVGIPAHMLGSIFDLFTQVERSLARSQGGLGIGLTLVKRLVELHAGVVEVRSAGPGKGSEFIIRLPALADAPHNGRPHLDMDDMQVPMRRILLVDDNEDAAESLGKLLRLHGHDVWLAHDGPSALKTAALLHPQIVILDIGLPDIDGYEVARRLREDLQLTDVLLVALTGYGRDEDRHRSREAGFHVHLIKPVDLDALHEVLAHPDRVRQEAEQPRGVQS
jgi:signal transduction histidine kinase/CheY-like chemotaxis protein